VTEFNFNKQQNPMDFDLRYDSNQGIYLSPRDERTRLLTEKKMDFNTAKKHSDEEQFFTDMKMILKSHH
jgi:hypothetical protein